MFGGHFEKHHFLVKAALVTFGQLFCLTKAHSPQVQVSKFSFCQHTAPEENSLPADIRYTIYCTAISSGKESDWNFLWNRFQNVLDSPSEKSDILSALTCTKEIWILQVSVELKALSVYLKFLFLE